MRTSLYIVLALAVIACGWYVLNSYVYESKQPDTAADYKNATYRIDGRSVVLVGGVAEEAAAPGSASKVVTRYFGNDLNTDLDGDGREDVVFLLTQDTGGSGTFYYVVGALNTERGYIGTEGYLLGDRIAPQTIDLSQNPRHQRVIVANYAIRLPGEPLTAKPSLGTSVYLKLDAASRQWAIVEPDFSGEAVIELHRDLYPLYSGAGISWGPMEAKVSPSYGRVAMASTKPAVDVTNVAEITMPFEKYYKDKLTAAGWTWDMDGEAGGPTGNVSLYRKGADFVVISYRVDLKVDHPDAPSECPCDVTLSLTSGRLSH